MSESRHQDENPYVGLRPFRSEDSLYFFGRNSQVRELLPRLETSRFLAVVGGSGCGKSSLIHAGLIPALEAGFLVEDREAWLITSMRPGDRARHRLCSALAPRLHSETQPMGADELNERVQQEGVLALIEPLEPRLDDHRANLLILVDQFEELFEADRSDGVVRPSDESRDFVKLILDLASAPGLPVYIVLTMRSDFLGDCSLFERLPEAMNRSQYLVPRLGLAERREAIVGPASLCGQRISPALVNRLLSEQLETQDDLPVLQHALRRTWDAWRRQGAQSEVSIEHYERAGTVWHALETDAEQALEAATRNGPSGKSSPDRLQQVKRLFQALTVTDAAHRWTRRARRLRHLAQITGASEAELLAIAAPFADAERSFLVISDEPDPLIDISHESLIRQWPRLQEWVRSESESAARYRDLVDAVIQRRAKKKELYRGADLAVATRWREEQLPNEAWAQQYAPATEEAPSLLGEVLGFLDASRRARRWWRTVWIGSTVAVMLILGFATAIAVFQKRKAEQRTRDVESARIDEARALAVSEWTTSNNLVLLKFNELLVASLKVATNHLARTIEMLDRTNAALRESEGRLERTNAQLVVATRAAQSNEAAAEISAGAARLAEWRRTTNLFESQLTSAIHLSQGEAYSEALRLLRATHDIPLTNIDNGRISTRNLLEGHVQSMSRTAAHTNVELGVPLRDIAINRQETWLIASGEGGRAAIFDLAQCHSVTSWTAHAGTILAVDMDPEGRWAITAGEDNLVKRWSIPNLATQKELRLSSSVVAAVLSPDGAWAAAASQDGRITVFPAETWEATLPLPGTLTQVSSIAFSPDSRRLVAASKSGRVDLWERKGVQSDWRQVRGPRTVIDSAGVVRDIAFTPSGDALVTGCADGTLGLWGFPKGELLRRLNAHRSQVGGLGFAQMSGRELLLSAGADLKLKFWDRKSGDLVAVLEGHRAGITGIAAGNRWVYSASNDRSWRKWPVEPPLTAVLLTNAVSSATSCALSPNARLVAVGAENGAIRVLELPDGTAPMQLPQAHDSAVSRLQFSPDGAILASAGFDGRIRLWSTTTWQLDRELDRRAGAIHALTFSPDGRRLAIASAGSEAHLSPSAQGIIRPAQRGEVVLFELEGVAPPRVERVYNEDALSVAFDDEGKFLLSAGIDPRAPVRWWPVDDFPAEGRDFPAMEGNEVAWASFWPRRTDSKAVALVGRDGAIRWIDPLRGTADPGLLGHQNTISRVEISPDGAQAFTVSTDGTLRAWDLHARRELFALRFSDEDGREASLRDFSFVPRTPRGNAWIAVPLSSGSVAVYDLGPVYP